MVHFYVMKFLKVHFVKEYDVGWFGARTERSRMYIQYPYPKLSKKKFKYKAKTQVIVFLLPPRYIFVSIAVRYEPNV